MGLLDETLQEDSQWLVDTDQFGEAITYTPGDGGAARSINAVIDRQELMNEDGTLFNGIFISVRNNATYGISLAEFDKGADTITIAERLGGTATKRSIVGDPIAQDAGMIRFRVA